ncbi:toll/interleukin-1 receptor domain-containing protein [Algoriphagus sp.]|uniref:toll/interleukin-1 receptor domain-containing protein n=2 Tax=Algoriphagus sp. TaxID=1872435 RepID=UPI003279323D
MPSDSHAVFISYAWGGESEIVANEIDQAISSAGITLIRDKRDLGFKGLIKEFMEQIGQGHAVILVISDNYLKSPNCMFELLEVQKSGDFYQRVFPLVLPDAAIYKSTGIISYLKYWEDQIDELNEAIKKLDSFADTQGIRDDIDLYTDIRGAIAKLAATFRNMNTLTVAEMRSQDFAPLLKVLGKRVAENTSTIPKPKSNYGKILYHIPDLMQIQEWTRCIVRLAWDELLLTENLTIPDTEKEIDDIRMGEVMQVCIEEGRDGNTFEIQSLSSKEQIILVDDYTEWLFDIKALREGTFTLVLRVTLLQIIEGFGERKKDIVLERNVTTRALAPETLPVFEAASVSLAKPIPHTSVGSAADIHEYLEREDGEFSPQKTTIPDPPIKAAPSMPAPPNKKPKSVLRKLMPYAASITLLIAAILFILPELNEEYSASESISYSESVNSPIPSDVLEEAISEAIKVGSPQPFEGEQVLLLVMDPSQESLPTSEQTVSIFMIKPSALDSMRLDSMHIELFPAADTSRLLIEQLKTYHASEIEDSVKVVRQILKKKKSAGNLNAPAARVQSNN